MNLGVPTRVSNSAGVVILTSFACSNFVQGGTQNAVFDSKALKLLTTAPSAPNVPPPVHLANISTRLVVGSGDNVLIAGFIITGSQPKKILLRALGPALPLNENLADPTLELHDSSGALMATNDNWRDTQQDELKATTLPPGN